MDTLNDPDIFFDENGICNYFYEYQQAQQVNLLPEPQRTAALEQVLNTIRTRGKGKRYDCLIGLSGGIDSTYVAWLARRLDLRPLAVHLDNGWDSELAVANMEKTIQKLQLDLVTVVVDWEEFKDIQLAYLKASVVDIEVVSDHAIFASLYKAAKQYRIPFILSGSNVVTEHIMPPSWLYDKMDYSNLRHIHRSYGLRMRRTYPTYTLWNHLYYSAFLRLSPFAILNYIDYNVRDVKAILQRELGWQDHGGKHYESVFTRFYQAYILPKKFGVDKRKAHFSNLICSGQMTRQEALSALQQPAYPLGQLERDKEYVLKKLGLTFGTFQELMARPRRSHDEFRSDRNWKKRYLNLLVKTAPLRRRLQSKA